MKTKTKTPVETLTPVERWLASLGLEAIEVGQCPVADCEICAPLPVAAAA